MNEKKTFKALNDDGKEIMYESIFTFDSDKTEKSYIIYTDNTKDKEGKLKLYASTYNPNTENIILKPIETDEEWEMIDKIIKSINENI